MLGNSVYQRGVSHPGLWAVRRALELIVPGSKIVAPTLEGVAAVDSHDLGDAVRDGVDAACKIGASDRIRTGDIQNHNLAL